MTGLEIVTDAPPRPLPSPAEGGRTLGRNNRYPRKGRTLSRRLLGITANAKPLRCPISSVDGGVSL
jgi:hypothetical protein